MGLPRTIVSLSQKGLDRLWGSHVIMWEPGTCPLVLSHSPALSGPELFARHWRELSSAIDPKGLFRELCPWP